MIRKSKDTLSPLEEQYLANYEALTLSDDHKRALAIRDLITSVNLADLKSHSKIKLPRINTDTEKKAVGVVISDVHYGKTVYRNDLGSKTTTYNTKIAEDRIAQLFQRLQLEIIQDEKGIDEVFVLFVGDMIEGDGNMFSTQMAMLDISAQHQTRALSRVLKHHIHNLSDLIGSKKKLSIYAAKGNHGEQRGKGAMDARNNWDTSVYIDLLSGIETAHRYGHMLNTSIEFDMEAFEESYYCTIKGHKVLLQHKLPKNLSAPSGEKGILARSFNTENNLSLIFTGHYHTEAIFTIGDATVIRTGSTVGPDDYARDLGLAASVASQPLLKITKSRKIDSYIPVLLK